MTSSIGADWPAYRTFRVIGCRLGDFTSSTSTGRIIVPANLVRELQDMEEPPVNEKEMHHELVALMREISTLPPSERAKLEKEVDDSVKRTERLRSRVSGLQESLDYLRLSIKYLVFDLEATRRENGYLRKILEETSGPSEAD